MKTSLGKQTANFVSVSRFNDLLENTEENKLEPLSWMSIRINQGSNTDFQQQRQIDWELEDKSHLGQLSLKKKKEDSSIYAHLQQKNTLYIPEQIDLAQVAYRYNIWADKMLAASLQNLSLDLISKKSFFLLRVQQWANDCQKEKEAKDWFLSTTDLLLEAISLMGANQPQDFTAQIFIGTPNQDKSAVPFIRFTCLNIDLMAKIIAEEGVHIQIFNSQSDGQGPIFTHQFFEQRYSIFERLELVAFQILKYSKWRPGTFQLIENCTAQV